MRRSWSFTPVSRTRAHCFTARSPKPKTFFSNAVLTCHEQKSEGPGERGGGHTWGPCLYVFSRVLPLNSEYFSCDSSLIQNSLLPSSLSSHTPKQTMQTRPWVSCKSFYSSKPYMVTRRLFLLALSSTASGTPSSSSLPCMQMSVSFSQEAY